MNDEEKEAAAEHAKQALGQGKAAVRNATEAAKSVAEPVAEAAAEEVKDNVHKLEGTAQDAAKAVRRVSPESLAHRAADAGWGCFALSVSIYAGAIAFNKFRDAIEGRA